MLELENISILPTTVNSGNLMQSKFNFGVQDIEPSLPIFTSPMEAVVGIENYKIWQDAGIRPILPRTVPIDVRLEASCYIFAAFSKEEVKQHFLMSNRRNINSMFRICIDSGNGHDSEVLSIGKELKRAYGPQVLLMGGNIGNPKTYIEYCKNEFDYVRVGLSSGSLVDSDKYGFSYPIPSLLIDINNLKATAAINLKQTKIIVDGGIRTHSDIIKCIALGADYVMIGREFARLVEANGNIYKEVFDNKTKSTILEIQDKNELISLTPESLRRMELVRIYKGNTSYETQAERAGFESVEDWQTDLKCKKKPVDSRCDNVNVVSNLKSWLEDMYECFNYAFIMTSSVDWRSFKNSAKYITL